MSHISETLLAEYFATAISGGTTSDGEVFVTPDPPPGGFATRPGHRRLADAIARYLNKYDDPQATAATWTPTLYVGGTAHAGGYTERQGYFLQVADVVVALSWIRTSGAVNASAQSVAVGDLPSAGSMLTTLEFWPCFSAQAALLAGAIYPRLRPSSSTRIFINDAGTELNTTSWTFNVQLYFALGAVYRVS